MMLARRRVVVAGAFDDIRSRDLRFLEEAAKLGAVTVLLYGDDSIKETTGRPPRFPFAERRYLLSAVRFVSRVLIAGPDRDALPPGIAADIWADLEGNAGEQRRLYCQHHELSYHIISSDVLHDFPEQVCAPSGRRKVVTTGCFDWFHSGHVRFFEEASGFGDLFVVVGHDANIHLLKGEGHPLLPENERRYMVGATKYVTRAMISSGDGWLDAEPEIRLLKPDMYVVNDDGDKGGKREFCAQQGIEYVVLRRTPAPGLPRRSSTDLRGF